MHLADTFYIQSDSGYTFFQYVCVPWELNPQPFVLLRNLNFVFSLTKRQWDDIRIHLYLE